MNQAFLGYSGNVDMEHLGRTGSDHAPLLLICGNQPNTMSRPFRFLKFWVDDPNFKDVKEAWDSVYSDDVFLNLKLKMKKTKIALTSWSKATFRDISKQLVIREDIVRIKEAIFEEFPTAGNRIALKHAQAELIQYLKYEEEY